MSKGYSLRLYDLNRKADARKLGVRLGRLCIKHDVSVAEIAEQMHVTRQTVYNWFCGVTAPQGDTVDMIEEYIKLFD